VTTRFTCSTCGQEHDLAELSLVAGAPNQWNVLTKEERDRSELGTDQCITVTDKETNFYVRAQLEIPIRDTDRHFTWGVWCSLSEKSFDEMSEHWTDPDRTSMGPYFGWLCTTIPTYPDTMFLKTMVHQRPVGSRPWVELEPTDHPLAIHQRDGIEQQELQRMISALVHAAPDGPRTL